MREFTAMGGTRRGGLGRAMLALSVGLNIFLAGWLATQSLAPRYTKPEPAPEVVGDVIAQALPKQDGALLRGALAARRDDLAEARKHYLADLERVRQLLVADQVDVPAFHQAVLDLRQSRQAERLIFGDTIVGVLPKMSQPGRQAFVATHLGGEREH